MKLIYRGITYEHNQVGTTSNEQEINQFPQRRPLHYFTYRRISYTKFNRLNIFARGEKSHG